MCKNTSKITEVNVVPGAINYTWNISNSLTINNEATQVTNYVSSGTAITVNSKNAQGEAVITVFANISGGGVSPTSTYTIWGGTPSVPVIEVSANQILYGANMYTYFATASSQGATSYNWVGAYCIAVQPNITQSKIYYWAFTDNGSSNISVRTNNACGQGNPGYSEVITIYR
jgi:hypothetical protein